MNDWWLDHLQNIMLVIEAFVLLGTAAIFVLYFAVKRRVKKNAAEQAAAAEQKVN